MPDIEKIKTGIFEMLQRCSWDDIDKERHRFQPVLNDALKLLEEQHETIKSLEQEIRDKNVRLTERAEQVERLLKKSVPQGVVDQIKWERDTALSQLKEIGKGLGEKMDDVKPKWIPVTERKPKSMANKVIVYVEHEDLNPQIGYGHYEKFQGVEMWYNLETQEQFSEHGYTVTHWMPMPKSLDGKRLILD